VQLVWPKEAYSFIAANNDRAIDMLSPNVTFEVAEPQMRKAQKQLPTFYGAKFKVEQPLFGEARNGRLTAIVKNTSDFSCALRCFPAPHSVAGHVEGDTASYAEVFVNRWHPRKLGQWQSVARAEYAGMPSYVVVAPGDSTRVVMPDWLLGSDGIYSFEVRCYDPREMKSSEGTYHRLLGQIFSDVVTVDRIAQSMDANSKP
jgi:hypothetical protein